MIRTQVTKKQLKNSYNYIFSVKYSEAYYLLYHEVTRYYYANMYGWRFDVYEIDYDTVITNGYEKLKTYKNQDKIDKIIEKYNNNAYKIIRTNNNYEKNNKKLDKNLESCIKELKEVIDNEN